MYAHIFNKKLAINFPPNYNRNTILLLTEWEVSVGIYYPQPFPY